MAKITKLSPKASAYKLGFRYKVTRRAYPFYAKTKADAEKALHREQKQLRKRAKAR